MPSALSAVITREKRELLGRALQADLIELRHDLFQDKSAKTLAALRREAKKPLIFTLREPKLEPFLKLRPDYVDLDVKTQKNQFKLVRRLDPRIKIIASLHNFEKRESLDELLSVDADIYKIACRTHNALESIELLLEAHKVRKPLTAFALGLQGRFTRVLAAKMGAPILYAPLEPEDRVDEGQYLLSELIDGLRIKQISSKTAFYALLGSPVVQSPGEKIHNAAFSRLDLDARYLKIELGQEELATFLEKSHLLGFQGFSITSPLKERAAFVMKSNLGAINTLTRAEGGFHAANTDASGCIRLLEKKIALKGKRIVILGAGGAARGLAPLLKERLAHLFIFNRTLERAQKLALEIGAAAFPLEALPAFVRKEGYDVIIQTTSSKLQLESSLFLKEAIAVELLYGSTPFLKCAKKGCAHTFDGTDFFLAQALDQYCHWFNLP